MKSVLWFDEGVTSGHRSSSQPPSTPSVQTATSFRSSLVITAFTLTFFQFLGACSSPDEIENASPWKARYDEVMDWAKSDFIRSVLSDYKITPEEYAEAKDGFLACAEENGIDAFFSPATYTSVVGDVGQ